MNAPIFPWGQGGSELLKFDRSIEMPASVDPGEGLSPADIFDRQYRRQAIDNIVNFLGDVYARQLAEETAVVTQGDQVQDDGVATETVDELQQRRQNSIGSSVVAFSQEEAA